MTREYISESYSHIKDRLQLKEFDVLEPLFIQSMSYLYDELEKVQKDRDYWKLSFNKQVEAQRSINEKERTTKRI
mgnify:FL=1